ncbi:MAG: VanZ family protein, partial [Steroidobacteraceae bacterium]|nr:VanZ family protein [Steroidobacteraceae bacterium]
MRRGLPNPGHRRAARWIALGTALLIAWGSLYPLAFILPTAAQIKARLALAGAVVFSRTDLIANFLLYLPFGAICRLSLGGAGRARRPLAATLTATLIGSALAFTLELAQLATPHRVTNLIDWAVNTAGCACGALAIALYLRLGRLRRLAGLRHPLPALVPSCLLAIWIIGEFAPYLPTHHAVPLGRMLAEFHERRALLAAHASLALTRWWIIAECVRQIWR